MSRLDLVVFGATGFTGKYAVKQLSKLGKMENITWGIAGRSQTKLEAVLQEVAKKTGEDLSSIKIIIADVSDDKALKDMCSQCKVLVNCCGPYRLYGEPVVKAAIEGKAHYVDVSGEPQFIETMQLNYDKAARDAGVYIISACGLDSIPNDMGVVYMQQQFDGTLNSVESYLSAVTPENAKGAFIHYGTWESLVHSLAHFNELGPLRKKMWSSRLPTFQPKLKSRGVHSRFGKWSVPFMGADASIVYRTQRYIYETEHKRPVQFKPYVRIGGLFSTVAAVFAGAMLYLMCWCSFTRKLLLDHPKFFSFGWVSHEGPTEEVMEASYYKFELFGEGWARGEDEGSKPNKKIAVRVSGLNPGYGATTAALLYSAVSILKQKEKMPEHGGVLTTGIAFRNTDLVKHLQDKQMKFEVIPADK
ncbi:hypothetical protein O0L34_g18999 [Tuta absoluta]|nr:hypothetical protein O0L34_g18999 [Tuta absoluta]